MLYFLVGFITGILLVLIMELPHNSARLMGTRKEEKDRPQKVWSDDERLLTGT